MKVQDVMTREVRTTRTEAPLREAAAILARENISGLPVLDCEGRVVGVLSEGDILFKERGRPARKGALKRWLSLPSAYLESKAEAKTVAEAMSAPAITIGPGRPLTEAASTMIDEGVNRLPVVDENGSLLGIVTRADLVRVFVRSDEQSAAEIEEEGRTRAAVALPEREQVLS
jgi:CBS domain-containing protein